ncbi:M3 family metallopeptidase [Marinibactrum halimedae]|uniref:oligopeptidase A n=1 Tax=Marinibactrum halimedae TaxID=1444977 RepID=A0AA37T0E5_9GAMM|nr:M3 family metallopeptidase [Marinibactrum halimedae]MCD9461042.1 M3 family metallopeptidase [Marinibactrum halimedae]GLS24420.1 oligopeptidase A [Marinibactrum halimedae]
MSNPLLSHHTLPPFKELAAEHVETAIHQLIEDNEKALESLLVSTPNPTWENFVAVLEADDDRLNQAWSPVSHLNSVKNNEALRQAYETSLAALSAHSTKLGQHKGLFQAYHSLKSGDSFCGLSQAQQKTIDNALRDFHLAGVDLPDEQRQAFADIKQRLSKLSSQFSNNVLDATQGWHKHLEDTARLAGMPEMSIAQAEQAAKAKGYEGGAVLTLDIPSYLAVMTYADDRELRAEMYRAYTTRASSEGKKTDGESASEWDNAPLIEETLSLRHQMAELLGFENYAEYSLARKMAESPAQVEAFLLDLAQKSRVMAEQDVAALEAFAQSLGMETLEAWDVAYCSEKLKEAQYAVSQEALRPYFPAEKVIAGMFEVVEKLFGVSVQRDDAVPTWHEEAHYYRLYGVNDQGEPTEIAGFYLDIYARENKRGGAWMDECRVRRRTEEGLQLPVAYLTCNFTPPNGDTPSLLTHNEVTTLFHEFGHGLHHMLTQVDVAAVSGINGVEWDAVELPSQFLENWCWEASVITELSGHYQTEEKLPAELLEKMLAAKNFQSAMQMLRQVEFALFDLRLHWQYQSETPVPVADVLDQVRKEVAVLIPPSFNRFENGFSHIFAGGYAAGYYSYKWAEVLSSDAFSLFEENGIFDEATGQKFLQNILQKGGSEPAATLFNAFRGREPNTDALLRHSGILG